MEPGCQEAPRLKVSLISIPWKKAQFLDEPPPPPSRASPLLRQTPSPPLVDSFHLKTSEKALQAWITVRAC